MLYTLNLYSDICELFLNKRGKNNVFQRADIFNFYETQYIHFFLLWLMLFMFYAKKLCLNWDRKDFLLCFIGSFIIRLRFYN